MKAFALAITVAIFSFAPNTPAEQYPEVAIKARTAVYIIDTETSVPTPLTIQI